MTQDNLTRSLKSPLTQIACACVAVLGLSVAIGLKSPALFASELGSSRLEAAGQQATWPTESIVSAVPSASDVFGPGAARSRSTENKDYEKYMVNGHVQTF
jgi:hypothetical protein